MAETKTSCPHCGVALNRWKVPEDATWSEEYFLVCFNNSCSFYQEAWEWMKQQYNQKAGYRYMFNPRIGSSSTIPVWSDAATREMIMDEDGKGSDK